MLGVTASCRGKHTPVQQRGWLGGESQESPVKDLSRCWVICGGLKKQDFVLVWLLSGSERGISHITVYVKSCLKYGETRIRLKL